MVTKGWHKVWIYFCCAFHLHRNYAQVGRSQETVLDHMEEKEAVLGDGSKKPVISTMAQLHSEL